MSNPMNQNTPSSDAAPRNNIQGTNNPKLQSVNYVTILPEGKTSGYKEQQQVDFKIDPIQFPYIDGKQSYLLLNVTPTCRFSNSTANTPDLPLMFPPHMGANALVNRLVCRVNDGTGKIIEDREAYNQYNGIKNAYSNDSDVFPSLAKCEGVSGRNTKEINRTCDNVNNTYFYPLPDTTTTNTSVGGTQLIQNSFVLPIELGLFSAFGNQHHAVPNMDIGGVHLTYHLEKAAPILPFMAHKFYKTNTINNIPVDVVQALDFYDLLDGEFISPTEFVIDKNVCDANLTLNGEAWKIENLALRVGMPIKISSNNAESTISALSIDSALGQVKITLTHGIGTIGNDSLKPDDHSGRSYTIDKVELRVLNTVPDSATMKDIKRAVMRGMNFNTTQLFKISTAQALKNAVIDIPESLTKCLSIFAVPCQQDNLNSTDGENSYIFPRPDSILNSNNNDSSYQWQVRQVLIPNLQVDTNKFVDSNSDNVILFNQQLMAMRPMFDVRSLEDDSINKANNKLDLNLPFFYPLLLAPLGSSFNLIDSAPQLRIENTDASLTTAKLYFVHINHVRLLKGNGNGVDIEF